MFFSFSRCLKLKQIYWFSWNLEFLVLLTPIMISHLYLGHFKLVIWIWNLLLVDTTAKKKTTSWNPETKVSAKDFGEMLQSKHADQSSPEIEQQKQILYEGGLWNVSFFWNFIILVTFICSCIAKAWLIKITLQVTFEYLHTDCQFFEFFLISF